MKKSKMLVCAVMVGMVLGGAGRALANDDGDLLKQSEALLKQAWNPGGDVTPTNDQRTDLLNQAIELAQKEPDHRLRMRKVDAIRAMKAAVEELKSGNTSGAVQNMHDADRALRDAIEIAEGH